MIFYKVTHKYKLQGRFECKDIGIYSSISNAENAIEILKIKEGFKDTVEGFGVKKVFRFCKPKLLDRTFWIDGFVTYTY